MNKLAVAKGKVACAGSLVPMHLAVSRGVWRPVVEAEKMKLSPGLGLDRPLAARVVDYLETRSASTAWVYFAADLAQSQETVEAGVPVVDHTDSIFALQRHFGLADYLE